MTFFPDQFPKLDGKRYIKQIGIIVLLVVLLGQPYLVHAQRSSGTKLYLPVVLNRWGDFTTARKFLGIYMPVYWTTDSVRPNMSRADTLAGKKHSVSGWFISLQDIAFTSRQTDNRTNNFFRQLEALWQGGYISFVNIMAATQVSSNEVNDNCPFSPTAYQIAKGDCDKAIQGMAELYKQWIGQGGGRIAFIAPLPEMNGVRSDGQLWTSYGGDPANFQLAYQRFQSIFKQQGVNEDQVWWVFAPNGWSVNSHKFEDYYPRGSIVDAIGFSSYNFGYCKVAYPWQRWEDYTTLYEPYIERIYALAPNKPIIITQTGTTAEQSYTGENNTTAKNKWLEDNYRWLASQPQVLGIMYYDYDQSTWECNWRILQDDATFKPGYQAGASATAFQALTAQDLRSIIP
ncbi:hypothetical protein QYE77_06330 [Thermanaerothrix sp. 4228-RoL]|uniref:GH26 domain-containing protein n=1 Tax=Thermanaerothrix solaris TaxID=3058434 RepID=A0ABU3NM28_9CHLR|nr:hypothetical protein [Thermanaerothrix sp. 4228-RoL]MDT8897879.1 hypothetical protein [Thermanaerothrix sp. 4228-RoL]